MPLRWPSYSNSRSLLSMWESSANIVRRHAGLSSSKVMTQHKNIFDNSIARTLSTVFPQSARVVFTAKTNGVFIPCIFSQNPN